MLPDVEWWHVDLPALTQQVWTPKLVSMPAICALSSMATTNL